MTKVVLGFFLMGYAILTAHNAFAGEFECPGSMEEVNQSYEHLKDVQKNWQTYNSDRVLYEAVAKRCAGPLGSAYQKAIAKANMRIASPEYRTMVTDAYKTIIPKKLEQIENWSKNPDPEKNYSGWFRDNFDILSAEALRTGVRFEDYLKKQYPNQSDFWSPDYYKRVMGAQLEANDVPWLMEQVDQLKDKITGPFDQLADLQRYTARLAACDLTCMDLLDKSGHSPGKSEYKKFVDKVDLNRIYAQAACRLQDNPPADYKGCAQQMLKKHKITVEALNENAIASSNREAAEEQASLHKKVIH
jgi:hypothetical protein